MQKEIFNSRRLDVLYPHIAAEWDYEKNNGLRPSDVTYGSTKRVWWRCKTGHTWQARVVDRTKQGSGCPECYKKKAVLENGSLAEKYPEIAEQWNTEKNEDLTPFDVTPFSNKSVWWKCEKGHEWKTTINTRTANGTRCPYCSGHFVLPGVNDLATLYPEIAAMWHPTRNGSTTPDKVRTGSNKPYWWKCEKGHEWKRTVSKSLICGPVCPYCSGIRVNPGVNDFKTLYPQLAAQWHPTKNGSLKPEDVLPLSNRKVWWIDEWGHEWSCEIQQRVSSLSGCPYCANKKVLKGFNDLATVCPEIASQWHSNLNGALTPEMVTHGCSRRVWWQCSEGHVWKAIVYSRTKKNGAGCPVCAGKTRKNNSYSYVDEKIFS